MATICDLNNKTPEIEYPCTWEYKVIIPAGKDINLPLQEILGGKEYTVTLSNASKKGTYESFNVSLLVHNQDERQTIFEELKAHKTVKYVL